MQCTDYMEAILLFVNVKQKKLFSDPQIKHIHKKYFCLLFSLPMFQSINSPCNVSRKFHFFPKGHGTGDSGKEREVKISFYSVNSEIWSVREIHCLGERLLSLTTLPILFKYSSSSAF